MGLLRPVCLFFLLSLGLQAQTFKVVATMALHEGHPLRPTGLHPSLSIVKSKGAILRLGYLKTSLRIFSISWKSGTEEERAAIKKNESYDVEGQKYYLISEAPFLYCQLPGEGITCFNHIKARPGGFVEEAAVTIDTVNLAHYLLQRAESSSPSLLSALLKKYYPQMVGQWQKTKDGYRLKFGLEKNNFLLKQFLAGSKRRAEKVLLPANTRAMLSWRQSKMGLLKGLQRLKLDVGLPRWFQQDQYLVRSVTDDGSLYVYRMNNISRTKRTRQPRPGARRCFKKFQKGKFTIYRLAWKKKRIYSVFHSNFFYLLTDDRLLADLIRKSVRVNVPRDYLYFQAILDKNISERSDDRFLLKAVSQYNELKVRLNQNSLLIELL